ncbi:MAG: PQQ-binding-like beta-propeller repeat protein [Waterburya sp.]
MFRANFQRTGVYQATDIRQLRGLNWKFKPNINSSLSSKNWHILANNEIVCFNNNYGGNLYAYNAQTGQQKWIYQSETKAKLLSSAITDEVIYICIRQIDSPTFNNPIFNNYLIALELQSGQQKWQFKLSEQSPFSLSFNLVSSSSAPVVAKEVVYIGSYDGHLYAVDVSSGDLAWRLKITNDMALSSPAVKEDILCIGSNNGYLYAIDLTTEQEKWKFEIGGISPFIIPMPVIANDKVYVVGSYHQLYVLNLDDGQLLWTFNLGNIPLSYPAITNRIICIAAINGYLYALDADTGKQLWMSKLNDTFSWSAPIINQETVYISSQGCLRAIDLQTGNHLWQFQMPLSDQWVFKPQIWFFGLASQLAKAFSRNTNGMEQFSEPVIADGAIYVGCSNGYLYALH